jgi:hypothetical protein
LLLPRRLLTGGELICGAAAATGPPTTTAIQSATNVG